MNKLVGLVVGLSVAGLGGVAIAQQTTQINDEIKSTNNAIYNLIESKLGWDIDEKGNVLSIPEYGSSKVVSMQDEFDAADAITQTNLEYWKANGAEVHYRDLVGTQEALEMIESGEITSVYSSAGIVSELNDETKNEIRQHGGFVDYDGNLYLNKTPQL
jgi:hypothetical protein